MPFSPLARKAHHLHPGHGRRRGPVRGIVLHTTGSTIVEDALRHGADPLEYAVEHYLGHTEGPTYVIGHDGHIVQVADEDVVTWHAGVSKEELALYRSGSWRNKLKAHVQWDNTWNHFGFYDPAHLIGADKPGYLGVNEHFIGIEMTPLVPTPKGMRFTDAQHQSAGQLCADLAARYALFQFHWARGPRLFILTHEDVNPLRRFDSKGGWDPGALREAPYFALGLVLHAAGGRTT